MRIGLLLLVAALAAATPDASRSQEREPARTAVRHRLRHAEPPLPWPVVPNVRYRALAQARVAPGGSERIKWVYARRGLPVQVIAEAKNWQRICDPDGAVA